MDILNFVTQSQVLVTIAVLIMLAWRISYGCKNGLVAELLEIVALAVGLVAIILSADVIDQIFEKGNFHVLQMIIRIAIVVVIYRMIQGISRGSRGIKNIPVLGGANRLLGGAFGIVETYIWVRVLNYIIGYDFNGAVRYTFAGIVNMIKV